MDQIVTAPAASENPVHRLQRVAAIACGEAPPDPGEGAWFAAALSRHLREGLALDAALGLRTTGRTPRAQWLIGERNALLRQALELVDGDHEALAAAVAAYETRTPDAARARVEPDPAWPAVRKLLHRAAHLAGARLPTSERQLRRATRATSPDTRPPLPVSATFTESNEP